MRGWRSPFVMIAALALVAGVAAGCAPDAPTRVSTTVDIGCGAGTQTTPVDWYLPSGPARAVVWLQHGFIETKDDWTDLAPKVASQGYVVVAPSLATFDPSGCNVINFFDNTAFLGNLAALFAGIDDSNSALARSYAEALRLGARDTSTKLPTRLAFIGHSAGGEAVTGVADRLRTTYPATFAHLGGLVLEDPVNSALGTTFSTALTGLRTTPLRIYSLGAPANACNNNASGIALVSQLLAARPFRGAMVTTGTHGDVLGSSIGDLEAAVCGTPNPTNVAAVHALTVGWVTDQVDGTTTAALYPGGSTYQALVSAGTISTLP